MHGLASFRRWWLQAATVFLLATLTAGGVTAEESEPLPATEDQNADVVALEEFALEPCERDDDFEACLAAAEEGVATRGLVLPRIRSLTATEITVARSVFGNTISYGMVKVTNTLGGGGRPWTTNSPPIYTVNVGTYYSSLTSNAIRRHLLIHELAHVWQGQHLVPFMLNSLAHQTLSAITNGGDVAPAYQYTPGQNWGRYNSEQQASIVGHWYANGASVSDPRYRYIRDNIRRGRAF